MFSVLVGSKRIIVLVGLRTMNNTTKDKEVSVVFMYFTNVSKNRTKRAATKLVTNITNEYLGCNIKWPRPYKNNYYYQLIIMTVNNVNY